MQASERELPYTKTFNYYQPEEPDDSGGQRMEFRLIYQGALPVEKCKDDGTSARAKDKHRLRKHFHLQLRELWNQHPDLRTQSRQRFRIHFTPGNLVSYPGPNVRQIIAALPHEQGKPWLDQIAD